MVSKDEFEREVRSIVRQLLRLYKPQKVVLFGSLVRGEIRAGTDIDLFIVKSGVPELGVDRIRELNGLVRYRLATDFVVYTPEEVEQRLALGDPFVRSILAEGKVLYDAA
jgi:predicted nucleotidyltransferase